jgi:hypothetical protein
MKRPTDRGPIKSLRRFNGLMVQRFSIFFIAVAVWNFAGLAGAQLSSPGNNPTRSISGQFIITPPEQPPLLNIPPRIAAGTNLVRLDPALLAVSAERIKDMNWRQLEIKGQWRGQIYLVLHRAQSPDEGVTILSQPFTSGWDYRVELPDVLPQTRFTRALTGVVLLEYANRNALARSAEIPAWLTDGLSQQLLTTGLLGVLLTSPDKLVNGLPVTRLEKTQRGVDPLAAARQVLRNHPALTFEDMSWPTGVQLDGDDDGVYRASAQLFVSEVLKLKDGPARLRVMLESLPRFYNWQVAFRSAFREDLSTPLDVEKWWALAVVNFAAHDRGPGWTLAVSREKLDEILRVPAAVRTTSNSLPVRTEISLQAVIRNLEPERQAPILRTKLRDLEVAQFRVAPPYAMVTAEYLRAIHSYLGDRPPNAPKPNWAFRLYRSLQKPSAATTVKKLDALDARRRDIAVQTGQFVQPNLAPLKF